MSKLVLDTNCLIQCISHRSSYHKLWLSFIEGRNILCVSNDILEEYEEILQRKTSMEFARIAINIILNNPNTKFVTVYYRFNLITTDLDDNKFVDCAIAANARFIVTENKHYDILSETGFPKVEIVSLDEMMNML